MKLLLLYEVYYSLLLLLLLSLREAREEGLLFMVVRCIVQIEKIE